MFSGAFQSLEAAELPPNIIGVGFAFLVDIVLGKGYGQGGPFLSTL